MQIATGVLLVVFVAVGIYLINKYNIKVSNIKNLSQMITGGTLMVSLIIIGVSVVKSFALVFLLIASIITKKMISDNKKNSAEQTEE